MEGTEPRTKLCHFVYARLLSTFLSLSTRFNQDDASILITRCSERMAYLTLSASENNAGNWIKPLYRTNEVKIQAGNSFQEHVFYYNLRRLPESKSEISRLLLQSQNQNTLLDYVNNMPILIEYKHFKRQLQNPANFSSPLNMLTHFLSNTGLLSISHLIYDLSQFYILLHQGYNLLIEYKEFETIKLSNLHQRAKQNGSITDQRFLSYNKSIIDKGIEAVNAYHKFNNGFIQPGACAQTQHFQQISWESPVHYLVTTDNHDEGDIVMRILR